jgi:glycine/D-amino acid oxidase-like deaminating enzyme
VNIAVIGGGIFGCVAAARLAEDGHDVALFERAPQLMTGASRNNQNRLHLGFHYPRDVATVRQCARGFQKFKDAFAPAIRADFPNAYFIASQGSLTSPETYKNFCSAQGLTMRPIDLGTFRPCIENVSFGLETDEVVYDAGMVCSLVHARIERSGAQIATSAAVDGIERRSTGGFVLTPGAQQFDVVVNCTYASQAKLDAQLGHPTPARKYEYTAIAIIDVPWHPVGATVMDGPFMTMIPFGHSRYSLLYHVDVSVIAREERARLDSRWLDPKTGPMPARRGWFRQLVERASFFVPAIARAKLVDVLEGPRMVLAKVEATDARPSILTEHEPGYFTVFSGKIDHCIDVGDDLAGRLQGRVPSPR